MSLLTEKELCDIDKKVDNAIMSQKLLSISRDEALIHMLRYYEDYVRIYAPKMAEGQGEEAFKIATKLGQDGIHFAILWICKYCPNKFGGSENSTYQKIYGLAHDLHEVAKEYSMIWDLMNLIWRKMAVAEYDSDGKIRVKYSNQKFADIETAAYFINAPDYPLLVNNRISAMVLAEITKLVSKINVRNLGGGKIKYDLSKETYERTREIIQQTLSPLWELDPSWDLGGYKLSDFRIFWISLSSFCFIHNLICFTSGTEGVALNSVVKIATKEKWEKELAKRSGLNIEIVQAILNDLIYDPNLYAIGKQSPDVTCQPFFPIGSELLALSNQLVLSSNAERNLWYLSSIIREKIHSQLRNQKESLWIRELSPWLLQHGLGIREKVKFTINNASSDIDMLILDNNDNFGIGCQLKWLNFPDRIKEVKYAEKELEIGLNQAELSQKWLDSKSEQLRRIIGVDSDNFDRYEFRTMVLSKNTLGSGRVYKLGIPIINQRLLEWIIGEPHNKSLRTLWDVAEKRTNLPKRGIHFLDQDRLVEFGGVQFIGNGLAMSVESTWDPLMDINFS